MSVVKLVVLATQENLERERESAIGLALDKPANASRQNSAEEDASSPTETSPNNLPIIGEGGVNGQIEAGKSVVFATLEVCLCVLIRHMPALNPAIPRTGFQLRSSVFGDSVHALISDSLKIFAKLPTLCSHQGSVSILPTLLFLTTGVIKELAPRDASSVAPPVAAALQTLKVLCTHAHSKEAGVRTHWMSMLRSAFATMLHYANSSKSFILNSALELRKNVSS